MTIQPLDDIKLAEIRAGLVGLPDGPWTVEDRYESGNLDGQRFDNGPAAVMALSDCEIHPLADCSCNHTCRVSYEQAAIAKHFSRLDPQTILSLLARLDKAEAGWQAKPLEWKPGPFGGETLYAESILGSWSIWEIGAGYVRGPNDHAGKPVPGGIEAAKAAAQTDYEGRIRSAFLPPPPSAGA